MPHTPNWQREILSRHRSVSAKVSERFDRIRHLSFRFTHFGRDSIHARHFERPTQETP